MTDKHTPGPWELDDSYDGEYRIYKEGIEQDIAHINVEQGDYTDLDLETVKANAHLISAAPDLLAALESIVTDKDGDGFVCRESMYEIYAAIAKARGE